MSSFLLHPEVQTHHDFLSIAGTDYVEFYVGNARQSAYFYRAAFGMSLVAWAGPETGLADRSSYVLQQGEIRFVLTTPLRPSGSIADHIHRHGDGVRDIALIVADAKLAWREATRRGARSVHECHELRDEYGRVRVASIAAYGDTIHTFVERDRYYGPFLPGYEPASFDSGHDPVARPVGLTSIDHIAANVGWNELHRWTGYYNNVLGFSLEPHSIGNDGFPATSACNTSVLAGANHRVLFPIQEPVDAREKSSVEEYLEFYHGPGVQHVALATDNIVDTVERMRNQGVEFMPASAARNHLGFNRLTDARDGGFDHTPIELARLDILAHRDEQGDLFHAFTRPVEDRPTLFFEVLQRPRSQSTGWSWSKGLEE
jgi:4-hydroxyphenylpyruvate dioxygenase